MDYNNSAVGGNGCAYTSLYNYNTTGTANRVAQPLLVPGQSAQVMVVPSYGGMGYGNMMRAPQQSGVGCYDYYALRSAYPNYPNSCGAFNSRLNN